MIGKGKNDGIGIALEDGIDKPPQGTRAIVHVVGIETDDVLLGADFDRIGTHRCIHARRPVAIHRDHVDEMRFGYAVEMSQYEGV